MRLSLKILGLVLFLPMFAISQKNNASVKGIVIDSSSNKGLAYATVSIVSAKDSSLVSFTRADSLGKFTIPSVSNGNYLLSASYVGFIPVWKAIQISDGKDLILGTISMTDVLLAGNVTVIAKRPPITINNDTVEFNTENFATPPNAVVEDLLKRLPGIVVDPDGTVKINGQKVNKVLVNGKEFFTGDPKMATKNLEANAIDKVQVFEKKSDQSMFTGVDDGSRENTINLKLKKDRNNAIFGKLSAGAGFKGQYESNLNLNRFNGEQQMSLLAMSNNVNKQGFGFSDIMGFSGGAGRAMRGGTSVSISMDGGGGSGLPIAGMSGQQGIANTFAGGLNFNDQFKKKTDFNSSLMASDTHLDNASSTVRQNFFPGNNFNYYANSNSTRDNNQQRINLMFDSKIDSFTSFKFSPQFTKQQSKSQSFSDYQSITDKLILMNQGTTDNRSVSDGYTVGGSLLLRKRFKKKGRTISSNLNYSLNNSSQSGNLTTRNIFYAAGVAVSDSLTKQINSREGSTNDFGVNLVYTEPIGKKSLLEFNGYFNANKGESKRFTYDYNQLTNAFDRLNKLQSNDFENEYNYNGGGINFRTNQKKVNLTIGSALQHASLLSINHSTGIKVQQDFTDLLPKMNFQFRFTSSKSLNIDYNTSTTQPSTTQLQPVPDVSDPLNTYSGNPNLKRTYAHTVNLMYFSSDIFTQTNFFAFVSGSKMNNAIVNSDIINSNGARVSTPVNVNGNYFLNGSVNAGFGLKKLKSRVDFSLSSSLSRNISFVNNQPNEMINTSISPSMNYSFFLENKVDVQLVARLGFSKATNSLQPQLNSNFLQQAYGLTMNNYLPFGLMLNNEFNYTINSGRADGFNTKVPFWNASLAKSFLKNKRGELKFTVFDLLNQNVGVNRNTNLNFIEDVRYNVLQRYFLLTATISLNKSGGATGGVRMMMRTIN